MAYQVKIEKMIGKPVDDVFGAIREGRLFINCSADSNMLKIDFRVGGKYRVEFKNHGVANWGEFLEIIPNKKLVFTWCQTFGDDQKPDSQVTIELFADGSKTRLVLVHDGFKDKANCDGHYKGWDGGLNDLSDEMENGRLRMLRVYNAPVEKLYEVLKNPASFFAFMGDLAHGSVDFRVGGKYQLPTKKGEIRGEFLEIIPNKKIALSWLVGCSGPLKDSRVTMTLTAREKDSTLELVHEGLMTKDDQVAHRQGWDVVTVKMSETLAQKG